MTVREGRPPLAEYFIQMARLVATRSTCRHRAQGAVLVIGNRVISTGYNGSPPGEAHCIELGGYCAKSEGLDCRATGLHGESNAIVTAARLGIPVLGSTLYSVYSPCLACCNILAAAGVTRIVYAELYDNYPQGPRYLEGLGIEVVHWT